MMTQPNATKHLAQVGIFIMVCTEPLQPSLLIPTIRGHTRQGLRNIIKNCLKEIVQREWMMTQPNAAKHLAQFGIITMCCLSHSDPLFLFRQSQGTQVYDVWEEKACRRRCQIIPDSIELLTAFGYVSPDFSGWNSEFFFSCIPRRL